MKPTMRKFALASLLLVFLMSSREASANPIGDFFKKVGNSISNLGKKTPPPRKPRPKSSQKNRATKDALQSEVAASPSPTAPPTPVDIRPAAIAPPATKQRDVPYALAVPDKPGFVTSPYAPNQGFVDVRAFPSSTEVLDPFTGKIFLTP